MTEEYLSLDGVGESPLPDYPGRIVFPHVMTLPMHKRWQAFVNNRPTADADSPWGGIVFPGVAPDAVLTPSDRFRFSYEDVELALLFGKLDVTGPDGKKLAVKTSDDLPLPVAAWIARCYREWENAQLFFRWNVGADMAAPDSAA